MAKNTKRSITFKVLIGYLLLTAFAGLTVWFVYGKFLKIADANQLGNINNRKLFLISEAVTNLYTAEGISRDIIQNERAEYLPKFNAQLDTIHTLIDSLKDLYEEPTPKIELDSINELLKLKSQNLIELLQLRKTNQADNYYDRVLTRLQKENYLFEDDDYEKRLKDLKPYQRKVLTDLLEYAKKDNAKTLTQQSADSLINSMKNVLSELEIEERKYQKTVSIKENELLLNDQNLSIQLRKIRAEIEQDEMQKSISQVTKSREMLEETSEIIIGLGIACLLTISFFVALILKDTKRSQVYRERLEKSKNYTEFLLKSREQIMATVTHDLRSPLNTIAGYSDLLNQTSLSDKQLHYLAQLKKSSGYILRLVNDLLDFSKLEAGKIKIEKLPFNPKTLIDDSIAGVIPSEDPKHLLLDVQVAGELDKSYLSDPFRIQQILTNLIGNAYKFTEEGSIHINAELDNSSIKRQFLKISIQDTGIGISKEHQQLIFEEFSQAKASIEKQYGGSGLGLAITKKLVNLLDGTISLESKLNKGSTFVVCIPIENAKHTFSSKESIKFEVKNPTGKKLLIVDDEYTQLAMTQEIIKQAGFEFEAYNNAKRAFQRAQRAHFDLILTDIQMPQMNGFQFIRKLKAHKKTWNIPVVALSGRTEINQAVYTEKGFETNLIKPFHPNELLLVIARILDLQIEKHSLEEHNTNVKDGEKYNLSDIYLFTDGDEKSLQVILGTFVQNTHLNLRELKQAEQKKAYQKIANIAHKMLPMLRQLKAEAVIIPLEKLEKLANVKLTASEITTLVTQAINETNLLLEELKNVIE